LSGSLGAIATGALPCQKQIYAAHADGTPIWAAGAAAATADPHFEAHAAMPQSSALAPPRPLVATQPRAPLAGNIRVPGDKSISHRALMLGALAVGRTEITGLLEGEDVLSTAAALNALGAAAAPVRDGSWTVDGVGVGGLGEPENLLDLGNSGTSARLLLGILATHPLTAFVTGDASLRRRPMGRVTEPLGRFGAKFLTRDGARLPLAVTGAAEPVPIEYRLPVPSAQVKSAVLLAGLNTPGATTVIEPQATRDHTERMLRHFGATVAVEPAEGGGKRITVEGFPELAAAPVAVPGDISSAAFPLVAALIVPGSEVTIEGVGVNPLRSGLLECLREMDADVALVNEREEGGEPVADLRARAGALRAADIPAERAPRMIDEYPILAMAAACARGRTVMRGLAELRVKESDRLSAIATGLAACGARVAVEGDDLIVDGAGNFPAGGATIGTALDHRIAMAFLVLGLAADEPVRIDDARPIATSFPDFEPLMARLGAAFREAD
jgi:3-phosphoshikimate 1-carboxyvinyltransferase